MLYTTNGVIKWGIQLKYIKRATFMIAAFVAVFSLSLSFVPQSEAGVDLEFTIGAFCGGIVDDASLTMTAVTTAGTDSTGTITIRNTGTGTVPVSTNLGAASNLPTDTGGFRGFDSGLTHILPSSVDIDAGDTNYGASGVVPQIDAGTDAQIADLPPIASEANTPRDVVITAHTNALVQTPAVGQMLALLTITFGTCF